jgi:excisionase family DNA binding protein
MSDKKYLRPKEVADRFGVTLATVRRWVKQGVLPAAFTPGGHSRIIAKDFNELWNRQMEISQTLTDRPDPVGQYVEAQQDRKSQVAVL